LVKTSDKGAAPTLKVAADLVLEGPGSRHRLEALPQLAKSHVFGLVAQQIASPNKPIAAASRNGYSLARPSVTGRVSPARTTAIALSQATVVVAGGDGTIGFVARRKSPKLSRSLAWISSVTPPAPVLTIRSWLVAGSS
jgi:hypothetical protein